MPWRDAVEAMSCPVLKASARLKECIKTGLERQGNQTVPEMELHCSYIVGRSERPGSNLGQR